MCCDLELSMADPYSREHVFKWDKLTSIIGARAMSASCNGDGWWAFLVCLRRVKGVKIPCKCAHLKPFHNFCVKSIQIPTNQVAVLLDICSGNVPLISVPSTQRRCHRVNAQINLTDFMFATNVTIWSCWRDSKPFTEDLKNVDGRETSSKSS